VSVREEQFSNNLASHIGFGLAQTQYRPD